MRGLLVAAIVVTLVGCGRASRRAWPLPTTADSSSTGADSSGTSIPFPLPSARRPTRRYYFERVESRCGVFSVDHGKTSPRSTVPCLDRPLGR